MKALLSAVIVPVVVLLSFPTSVFAWGRLSLYTDPAFSQCTLSDTAPRQVSIYMAERYTTGATGARFRIAPSAGFTGVWLSETSPYVKVGNSQTDLSIGYNNCLVGQFPILTLTYQLFGTSTCSDLSVVPPPGFSQLICTGCLFAELPCFGSDPVHINCDGSFNCNPVATEPTTWGSVKALYRN